MNSYLNNDLKIFKFLTPNEQEEILNRLEEDFKKETIYKMLENSTHENPFIFGDVVLIC